MRTRLAALLAALVIAAALPASVLAAPDDTATGGLRVVISAPGHARSGATFTVTVRLVNTTQQPIGLQLTETLPLFPTAVEGSLVRTYQDPRLLAYTGGCGPFACSTNYISLSDIGPGSTVLFQYEVTINYPGPDGGATFAIDVISFDGTARAYASKTVTVPHPDA
jgi:hypothetical protein